MTAELRKKLDSGRNGSPLTLDGVGWSLKYNLM